MRSRARGFGLVELLISAALVAIAAMAAVAYVTRSTQHADWAQDKVFARQKALSILAELQAFVEGGEGEVAADLDGFDDGLSFQPSLTTHPDPAAPGAYLPPNHPLSGNVQDQGVWRWLRRISVRRFPGVVTRDLRICTVRVYRLRPGQAVPGEMMSEVSSVIRTIGDAYPTTQVYDVYLLAMDSVPGWWVYMDAIQPFIEATLTDLESRNPGLEFRAHWITVSGYGRDEEYAPYINEVRTSRDNTPWAYVYPGRMPTGEAAQRYYVADRLAGRINVDGEWSPSFQNDLSSPEVFVDGNGNGRYDVGEAYTDANGNGQWDVGNLVPFAVADMHNHCLRAPEAQARFEARVAAGLETEDTPTWRLLLDRMIADPDRYHNAILINLHGELLPMPPLRNTSDPAKTPLSRPGWRVVTHPEHLRPRRVPGNDTLSVTPRWRLHAWKTSFDGAAGAEALTTQEEPFIDADASGSYSLGEAFQDWNGNGFRDDEFPVSVDLMGVDLSQNVNGAINPTLRVLRLPGGVDADGNGVQDPYRDWAAAVSYPEGLQDLNGDGRCQVAEAWLELNGNGLRDASEPYVEQDGDGLFTAAPEPFTDTSGNARWDRRAPAETFTDLNGNGRWDPQEAYWDVDGDGAWDPPTALPPPPWQPWDPNTMDPNDPTVVSQYVQNYGEPFLDQDADETWDLAEPFFDGNLNGVCDGGWARGEMWYEAHWDGTRGVTRLVLHGTPLETPLESATGRGLAPAFRLYDLDYVPCPTPGSATAPDRFGHDLYSANATFPKNTARWIVEMPLAALRSALESAPGAGDGDAVDRLLTVDTRWGLSTDSGTMWPVRNAPSNRTRTYAWFCDRVEDVPFSERFQFIGDPRHCPYADLDRTGTTSPNGYNWYFDDFANATQTMQSKWLAFDSARLRNAWRSVRGSGHDVPRILSFLRTAIAQTEAVYTTLTGFSYYYLSLGGDVGYDSANGFPNSIPMNGTPFGISGDVFENTITDGGGTAAIRGSRKFARSNEGVDAGIRSGGYWWAKPWLGELWPDWAYATQWSPWGNLRAATAGASTFRLIRRGDVTAAQQPAGTTLVNAYARLKEEGCTSLFNIGTSTSTFHHQYRDGTTGTLKGDGPQLATNYNFPVPTTARISRPFGLATNGSGGVGDEFNFTDSYPRFLAQPVVDFYDHVSGQTGSGLVRLQQSGPDPRGAYVVVNGIDRTIESGSAFIARLSLLSLIHSFLAAGLSDPNRIHQLPRTQIVYPTLVIELRNPASIPLRWTSEWTRWDGLKYTEAFPSSFGEDESDLVHVPLYSRDGGRTWLHMLDDSPATMGTMPWSGGGPDPTKTLPDANPGGPETWTWPTPAASFPEGSYVIRVESYRASESLHYSHHMEKIYVYR